MEETTTLEELIEQYKDVSTEDIKADLEYANSELNDCKSIIDKFNALKALEDNENWKAFKEMYFKDEKDRIAAALTSTQKFRVEAELQLQQKLSSIRHLKMFIENIETQAITNEQFVEELTERVEQLESILEERENGRK